MLLASAIIDNKNELNKCVTNLMHELDINISFRDEDVFVDKVDDMKGEMIFQTVRGISWFTPELKYSNGISVKMNPMHLKHSLDLFDENEPFKIYIYKTVCKLVQKNFSSSSPVMKVEELDNVVYHTRQIEKKLSPQTLMNSSVLEMQMDELNCIFRKISYAESYEKLVPFYTLKFDEKYSSIGKGDINEHYLSIQLSKFDFSGEPITVRVSEKIERAENMFNPDKVIAIKYHNNSIIHFSQDYSSTMKIDFLLGVMTK